MLYATYPDLLAQAVGPPSSIPVVLGPTGTLLLSAIALVLAFLNAYQWHKSTAAAVLRGTVDAQDKELSIYRARAERLEKENKEREAELAALRAKTDITIVLERLINIDNENKAIHLQIVAALKDVISARDKQANDLLQVIKDTTVGVRELGERMSEEFACHKEAFQEMTLAIRDLSGLIRQKG